MISAVGDRTTELMKLYDPWLWAYYNQIQLVGAQFQLDGHEFQVRPMSIRPPVKVIRKATQMAFTESEVLNCIHGLITGYYPVGIYYLFPNQGKVNDFSASRFNPLISRNPESIAAFVKDTNRANLKNIGSGFIYFRSGRLAQSIQGGIMKSSGSLKGDPCDHAVMDEYDEMIPCDQVDDYVDSRLAHSTIKTKVYLANPTLPDYGICSKFDISDQEYWHIKCRHCGKYSCLDDEDHPQAFPECLHTLSSGEVIRACFHCGRALDPRFGEWIAKRPDVGGVMGFTISQLNAVWIDPKTILDKWNHPHTNRANFYRLVLGRGYIEAENRLSISEVLACCGWDGIQSESKIPCTMGVDQGGGERDLLHVVIGQKHPVKAGKIVHLGVYKGWTELDRLMDLFRVSRCVIDGLPNQEAARSFAKRFPGRVFLSYFNKHQRGSYKWDEREHTVVSNRTEALDASHKEISGRDVLLPRRCDIIEDAFAPHCTAIAKRLEEDEETGSKEYVYIRLNKKDHFRFAFNYESMARNGEPAWLFRES